MSAADNAAHTVQGQLRLSAAEVKTTAAQRHPFFSLIFFLLRNTSNLRLGEAKRNKICHRHKSENLYTNKDSGLCSVILGSSGHPCCRLGGFHLLLERLKGPSHPST